MKKFLLAGATAITLGLMAGGAHAALSLVGGTAGIIPDLNGPQAEATDSNQGLGPLGFNNPLGGFYGAEVAATPGTYLFEYLGRETVATNTFAYLGSGGGSFATTSSNGAWAAASASFIRTVAAGDLLAGGLLKFSFATDVTGVSGADPRFNGNNPTPTSNNNQLNWFASFGQPGGGNPGQNNTSGDVLYLFLDDTGPNATGCSIFGCWYNLDDDNHDDMVIRISMVPVPEPATLGLLGAGLLGLGFAARRRRNA